MKKFIRIFDAAAAVMLAVVFAFVAYANAFLPGEVTVNDGESGSFSSLYSFSSAGVQSVDYRQNGSSKCELKLLGVIPVKEMTVKKSAQQSVYVSGRAFGIKLYTDGVIVVGTQAVSLGAKKVNPAEDAGIRVGDIIVSINNIDVYSSYEVTRILNENNGESYKIRIKRDGRYKTFVLTPVYSDREGCYKAGMWVRDSTAGIGTITFYNKAEGTFASLGHQINDVDTMEIMPLLEGEAVSATVTRVQKATGKSIGSLCCEFNDDVIGVLLDNNENGLYGAFSRIDDYAKAYPVAPKQEVKRGEAKIITTVDSGAPRSFDIEITHIRYRNNTAQRDIVFRVTDKKLLALTGGIVQGMSGSPIIQNGKLVGAVTHVIVNNPEKGYGIFAQTMVEESKL